MKVFRVFRPAREIFMNIKAYEANNYFKTASKSILSFAIVTVKKINASSTSEQKSKNRKLKKKDVIGGCGAF